MILYIASRLMTGLIRRVSLVDQELHTFRGHLSSYLFCRVRVAQSLVFCENKKLRDTNPTTKGSEFMLCGGELGCFGRVGSPCPTSGTRRVTHVTNPV